jgi:hypothetical protein
MTVLASEHEKQGLGCRTTPLMEVLGNGLEAVRAQLCCSSAELGQPEGLERVEMSC